MSHVLKYELEGSGRKKHGKMGSCLQFALDLTWPEQPVFSGWDWISVWVWWKNSGVNPRCFVKSAMENAIKERFLLIPQTSQTLLGSSRLSFFRLLEIAMSRVDRPARVRFDADLATPPARRPESPPLPGAEAAFRPFPPPESRLQGIWIPRAAGRAAAAQQHVPTTETSKPFQA